MKRIGMTINILPEKIDEYKKLHANVWPEVLKNLTAEITRFFYIKIHYLAIWNTMVIIMKEI